ncbi:C-X-C chemokine receptor type 3-like, partial [Clarias magur]
KMQVFDVSAMNFSEWINDTYEYDESDINCCGVVCDQTTSMHFEAIFIPILYSVAFVLGLMGNGLVLFVLCQKRRTWSVTDVFVLHLSVADILLLLTLPLWAVDAVSGWSFGIGFCKLSGALFK